MASLQQIELLRVTNTRIAALIEAELVSFFASLDLSRPEAARDALLVIMPELVRKYGDIAATVAVDWYDEARADARVKGKFRAVPAPGMAVVDVQSNVRFAASHLFTEQPVGTLDYLRGSATKYALQPGRDTMTESVRRDPRAVGWERVARAGGCEFCLLLAGRGGVYKETTVHFKSHGHCHCTAVPSWDENAPEVDAQAYQASRQNLSE